MIEGLFLQSLNHAIIQSLNARLAMQIRLRYFLLCPDIRRTDEHL